jgi:CheY-like chemotaxis protein
LVLNGIFQVNQPKAVSKPIEERPANRMLVVGGGVVTSGFASRPNHKETKPRPRVFVVDDEDFIRDLYRDVFESSGMTVFSAQSGEEAVKIFSTMKYKPDVVIMDHRMPGKDGIETTKEILRMDPSIPIIFSSADETVREAALAAGAVSFWAKPFPVTLLVNAMVDLVEARKKREAHHYH